jgi:Protein of unknown function DUF86
MDCWIVSIPERDLSYCHTVGGRKPTSSVGEISIPERDYRLLAYLPATFLPSCSDYTDQEDRKTLGSSHIELVKKVGVIIYMDLEVALVRLRLISKYVNTLEEFRSISLDEYLDDFRQQLIVERLLQLMTEAATDINKYILVQLHQISPETSGDSFIEAGQQGIITPELAA